MLEVEKSSWVVGPWAQSKIEEYWV